MKMNFQALGKNNLEPCPPASGHREAGGGENRWTVFQNMAIERVSFLRPLKIVYSDHKYFLILTV